MMIELPVLSSAPDLAPAGVRLIELLASPTRRRIVLALMRGEACNGELAVDLGLSQNLISHHIRRLREAGFVRERRDATDARWIYYTLDAAALAESWRALGAAFDPSRLGARIPDCGPVARKGR
ncbi:MAG TPA: metalloregulator ArsR/SmtB family transcription factor [Dehalococcoidia bacterium]|nr:metalloregulator ArsR/SmtB family transcription factor [Dehalococcoidia bacterium]